MALQLTSLLLLVAAACAMPTPSASAAAVRDHKVTAEMVSEVRSVVPGVPFSVGIRLRHDRGWHTYWKNPGDVGVPTTIEWELPDGFQAGPIQWPQPQRLMMGEVPVYGYEDDALLLIEIHPPARLTVPSVHLKAKVRWMMCGPTCLPGQGVNLQLTRPVRLESFPEWDRRWRNRFEAVRAGFPRVIEEWRLSASLERDFVILNVSPAAEGATAPQLDEIYFYSSDGQVASSGIQRITRRGKTITLRLQRSKFGPETPNLLEGILHSSSGWSPRGECRGMSVHLPWKPSP